MTKYYKYVFVGSPDIRPAIFKKIGHTMYIRNNYNEWVITHIESGFEEITEEEAMVELL